MFIGFPERRSVVRENMFPQLSDFPIFRTIHSLRTSELEYFIAVSVTNSTATVSESFVEETDASYGVMDTTSNTLTTEQRLVPGEQEIRISIYIVNDFYIEDNETITLRISPSTDTHNFECYDDDEDPVEGNYFCSHTITIVDEDGQFHFSISSDAIGYIAQFRFRSTIMKWRGI